MAAGGNAPSPSAGKLAGSRQRRIRNWALLVALVVLAGLVYGVAVVRMIEQHRLPHFF